MVPSEPSVLSSVHRGHVQSGFQMNQVMWPHRLHVQLWAKVDIHGKALPNRVRAQLTQLMWGTPTILITRRDMILENRLAMQQGQVTCMSTHGRNSIWKYKRLLDQSSSQKKSDANHISVLLLMSWLWLCYYQWIPELPSDNSGACLLCLKHWNVFGKLGSIYRSRSRRGKWHNSS